MHTTLRPKMAIIICSGGPTITASFASSGEAQISAMELTRPPRAEP